MIDLNREEKEEPMSSDLISSGISIEREKGRECDVYVYV